LIGERIKLLREKKSLRRIDLAVRAGVLESSLSMFEEGTAVANVKSLERIAGALGVPLKDLFYEGEEPPPLPNLPDRKTANDIVNDKPRKDRK
jgi:transcriptional regulator with XRE-family HTH domain